MQFDRLVKVGIGHHVKQRRKSFAQHRPGLLCHLDQGRPHVIGGRVAFGMTAVAARDFSAQRMHLRQCRLHRGESRFVDQRSDQDRTVFKRIADARCRIHLLQPLDERCVHMTVYKQPAKRGAALASSADGRKGDRAQRQFEVSRRTDHGRIVATEFKNCPSEALRQPRTDSAAHAR